VRYDFSADSDGTVTISLAGELDIRAVPALEAALAPTMAERPARVVIEASALEFADSSAIALFVRWASRTATRDPGLSTLPASPHPANGTHAPNSARSGPRDAYSRTDLMLEPSTLPLSDSLTKASRPGRREVEPAFVVGLRLFGSRRRAGRFAPEGSRSIGAIS
jgi:anti-anti-sigma factor